MKAPTVPTENGKDWIGASLRGCARKRPNVGTEGADAGKALGPRDG